MRISWWWLSGYSPTANKSKQFHRFNAVWNFDAVNAIRKPGFIYTVIPLGQPVNLCTGKTQISGASYAEGYP
ncbi:hypothetical protein [Sphingobacterium griseoflavum]|uniref:hypothetical protein n=1 Tax=Sphingobacterium griseoflavum TaxID=1474952 RepID=UPI001674F2B8|nr:hypothetical protein [Sphingobacterium griseoflavum]